MAGRRKYLDLRYMFMRGLQAHERMQRGKHYLKSAAECTSKAIVSLELSEKNINTAKQAMQLLAIGPETIHRLEGYVQSQAYSSDCPAPGRYVSSAGAILVALLNLTEMAADDSESGIILIGDEDLRNEAAKLSDEHFLPKQSPGFCQAWWRLEVLIKRDLVKRRWLHKASVYHLLPEGMELAATLRVRSLGQDSPEAELVKNPPALPTAIPASSSASMTTPKSRKRKGQSETTVSGPAKKKSSPPSASAPAAAASTSPATATSSPSSTTAPSTVSEHPAEHVLTDAMYSNDIGEDGVVLLVDTQECGGNSAGLAELCEMIEQTGTVYRTRKLPCADYAWLWRCEGAERWLPFLLERKRADDVAFSLKDGRFWGQIAKMTSQKEEFLKRGVEPRMQYVIEGKPENFLVHCADGCQGVGRCGNPTLLQVQRVLNDLKQHPQLELITVDSLLDTVRHLADTTTQLKHRVERGEFDAMVIAEMTATSVERAATEKHPPASKMKVEPPVFVIDGDGSNDAVNFHHKSDEVQSDCRLLNEKDKAGQALNRSGHSAGPRAEDDLDDLPPLHLPALGKAGAEQSRLVGQGASASRLVQDERGSPLRLNTSSGSPRGRVYLMKRKGGQKSPGMKNSVSKSCSSPLNCHGGTGGEWTEKEQSWGVKGSKRSLLQEDGDRGGDESALQTTHGRGICSPPRPSGFPGGTPHMHPGHSPSSGVTPASGNLLPLSHSFTSINYDARGLDHCSDASLTLGQDSATVNGNPPVNNSSKVSCTCAAKTNHPYSASSSSDTYASAANNISAAQLREDFSRVTEQTEILSPAAECLNSEKTLVRTQSGFCDGSDSEDSGSLPDLDLSVPPLPHRSPNPPPSPPSNPLSTIRDGREGEMTQWHRGNNSCEEGSSSAPKHPHNDDTAVEPANKIAQIAIVFPQMKGSQIAEVLRRFDGNVERSVIAILEEPGLMGKQSVPSTTNPPSPTPVLPSTTAADSTSASAIIDLTD